MIELNIEEIKEIQIFWQMDDWATIPKKYIKKLTYNGVKRRNNNNLINYDFKIICDYVNLEIDLEYIKKQKLNEYSFSCEWNFTESIMDRLEDQNVMYLKIIDKNEKCIRMEIPKYRKDAYCGKSQSLYDGYAKNICENHEIKNNNYIIKWKKPEKEDIYMNQEELNMFFIRNNLIYIATKKQLLAIELIERILKQNYKENSIIDKIEKLSREDKGIVVRFDKYKENIEKIINKLYTLDYPKKFMHGKIKKGYIVSEDYDPENGIPEDHVLFRNKAYQYLFSFLLVNKIDNKKDFLNLCRVMSLAPKDDTKNNIWKYILVFNDNINIEKYMLEYFRHSQPKNNEEIIVTEKYMILTTNEEINKIWYDIYNEFDLYHGLDVGLLVNGK